MEQNHGQLHRLFTHLLHGKASWAVDFCPWVHRVLGAWRQKQCEPETVGRKRAGGEKKGLHDAGGVISRKEWQVSLSTDKPLMKTNMTSTPVHAKTNRNIHETMPDATYCSFYPLH